uniref:Endonuclease/exonuclease/phosphatase domain-containing protein n=1 Tax=Rhipicephalus appendiculatus TaxID=34631 RepID=A0A131YL13_RHIAP
MTMYLAPNLSKGNIVKYIEDAVLHYETEYKHDPFVLAGDFNVDIRNDDWLVQHMVSRYALRCISYDYKRPTTIRGTSIDIAFSNFTLHPIQEPFALYFTDHKAIILKRKRYPELSHI